MRRLDHQHSPMRNGGRAGSPAVDFRIFSECDRLDLTPGDGDHQRLLGGQFLHDPRCPMSGTVLADNGPHATKTATKEALSPCELPAHHPPHASPPTGGQTTVPTARRQMHLGVFVLGTGNHMAGWRHDGAFTTHMELPVMQEIARIAERGKFDLLFISELDGDRSDRPSLVPVPLRADHPDHRARRLHHACRARRHGLDQLLRAVQRRPHLRLDRPHQRRTRRMERGHQLQPQGGAQLQSGRAHRARTTLRPCQRIRRCRPRSVGLLGGRRHRGRQGHRPVYRRREGAPTQPQGPVLQGARPGQYGALSAGPPGDHSGRRLALGAGTGGAHRGRGVLGGAGAGVRQGRLRRPQRAHGKIRPRPRRDSRCCPA